MNRFISIFLIICFLITNQVGICPAWSRDFSLPSPGVMVHLSPPLDPPILKGIKVHPDNPFRFDFILDKGNVETPLMASLQDESMKLIKYFLASLTIPEKDLWVNLSPYEKDRIIPNSFGLTEMGRDLLAEDYMLKQITASLIYPEDKIGKEFWKRIYEEAEKKFGTTNIPVNTFNKVWIVPQKAVVYENAKACTAYVVEAKLKVMLEQDYLSLNKHLIGMASQSTVGVGSKPTQERAGYEPAPTDVNQIGSQIVREIVIPELTKEVNEDKNFAQLRQVYNSLILATWYKKKIKDSILEQVYTDKNKVAGVNIDDPKEKERIYLRYLQAFKKGVFNYIKEEAISPPGMPSNEQGILPRKYFSGGETFLGLRDMAQIVNDQTMDFAMHSSLTKNLNLILVAASLSISLGVSHTMAAQNLPITPSTYEGNFDQQKALENILRRPSNGAFAPVSVQINQVVEQLFKNDKYNFLFDTNGFDGRHSDQAIGLLKDLPYADIIKNGGNHETGLLKNYQMIDLQPKGSSLEMNLLTVKYYLSVLAIVGKVVPISPEEYKNLQFEIASKAAFKMYVDNVYDSFSVGAIYTQTKGFTNQSSLIAIFAHELAHRLYPRYGGKPIGEGVSDLVSFGVLEELGEPGEISIYQKMHGYDELKKMGELKEIHDIGRGNIGALQQVLQDMGIPIVWRELDRIQDNMYPLQFYHDDSIATTAHVLLKYVSDQRGIKISDKEISELIKGNLKANESNRTFDDIVKNMKEMVGLLKDRETATIPAQPSNKTMSSNGGIDLTPANMNLQTQNMGERIKFHVDPAMLQQLQNAAGFVPVIISVQPLKSLQEFLGLINAS
jgi:hypothetical protein